ncbi:MAG: AraC family transcriptional regulator [Roseivirga sp.]|nr:AraC family transcriptional regulator [Roseivirga sp.]
MAFNGRFVLGLIDFAGRQGADIRPLLAISGQSDAELCQESSTLDAKTFNAVTLAAAEATGDPFFGLHLGESMNMTAAGLVAQITQTSETVLQALQYACDFAQLACSSLPMTLIEEDHHYKLIMTPDPVWAKDSQLAVKHTVDGTIVFTINEFHELTRKNHYPIKIELPFAKPSSTAEYERLFQCPVAYNQKQIALYFEKRHLQEKVVTSDYNLLRILVAHAQERIAAIKKENGFYEEVKVSVANLVKPEFPTIDQVAGHLNLSVRTLQRRLSEEGHTFKEIIESLRRDFALSYLKRPELSINEIAYLLSYTDASAFIRSFRRWEGITPNEYRKSL